MGDRATSGHRVVVLPYPGRGHINPIINFCKLMASKRPQLHIQIILTEEWVGYLKPEIEKWSSSSVILISIPNFLPSEEIRGSDLAGFLEAVQTEMEGPIEQVLDAIGAPLDMIVADSFLVWAVELGRRRNVPVASFWPASVTALLRSRSYPLIHKLLAENPSEDSIKIPGIPSIRRAEMVGPTPGTKRVYAVVEKAVSTLPNAKCIIFRSVNELEAEAIQILQADLPCPIFTIGPSIPNPSQDTQPNYITWLDSHPHKSVLYLSLGSFMSTSSSQMEELAAGIRASGVPFLYVGRDKACELSNALGDRGMVVLWCDQMRVLCHPSVGGFLTHCGWNSMLETVFAGVPALTFPLGADQFLNSDVIVEEWGIGWRVKDGGEEVVGREAVKELLRRFMELEGRDRKELDGRVEEVRARVLESVGEDGSTSGFEEFLCHMIQASPS